MNGFHLIYAVPALLVLAASSPAMADSRSEPFSQAENSRCSALVPGRCERMTNTEADYETCYFREKHACLADPNYGQPKS